MFQSRQRIRLENYNYSDNGIYFITICTKDKEKIFWEKSSFLRNSGYPECLSTYGEIVFRAIENIQHYYSFINVDAFTVMPNHIHLLLRIDKYTVDNSGRMISAPTKNISTIVGQLKRSVSKEIGKSVWQKSFYDHIIRDENDLQIKWNYIVNNPLKWDLDEYY